MIKFIIQLLMNLIEAGFLLSFIMIIYNKELKINIKYISVLILIAMLSQKIQLLNTPYGIGNFLGMFIYYIVFRLFYFKEKKIKLFVTICLGFLILLLIQLVVYSPIILLFHLNVLIINENLIYLLLILIPIYFIEYGILIMMYNKKLKNKGGVIL